MRLSRTGKYPVEIPVSDIARLVEGEIIGKTDTLIRNIAGIKEAGEGDLTFLANPKYSSFLDTCKASAIIVGPDVEYPGLTLIKTPDPYRSFTKVLQSFFMFEHEKTGVSDQAVIEPGATLGQDVSVYPTVYIGKDASIGDRTMLFPGVYIGLNTRIGEDVIIYPNATIMDGVAIGDRVIIHAGAVIGSDGFGFATEKGVHHKIPQLGGVIIEDDVEIGAGTTIDRATLGDTVIAKGTKIDNLVQIGHNVHVGEGSIIVAQVGISGSVIIGNHVTLGGQVGMVGHITIGDRAVVTAKCGITKSVKSGDTVAGFPAKTFRHWLKQMAFLDKGPEFMKQLKELEKRIKHIEKYLTEGSTDSE